MGIFGDIMSKIFGQSAKAETPAARTAAPSASTAPQASPAPSGTMTRTGPAPEGPKVEWSAPVDVIVPDGAGEVGGVVDAEARGGLSKNFDMMSPKIPMISSLLVCDIRK